MGSNLPDSGKEFSDMGDYGLEFSGVENDKIAMAIIEECDLLGIWPSRMICTVRGSGFYINKGLKKLAQVLAKYRIEGIICPYNLAQRLIDDPNNLFKLTWQNSREAENYLNEIKRCIKIGFRGFLAWTLPMLDHLNKCRFESDWMPPETIFKLSTFANTANARDFLFAESRGADTINVVNHLKVEDIAEIRKMGGTATIDFHGTFWDMCADAQPEGWLKVYAKKYDRIKDMAEIVLAGRPIFLKFELGTPGIGVYNIGPNWTFDDLAEHKRKDVRIAADVVRRIKEKYPHLKLIPKGAKHLRVPVVR